MIYLPVFKCMIHMHGLPVFVVTFDTCACLTYLFPHVGMIHMHGLPTCFQMYDTSAWVTFFHLYDAYA
jgi:hypothetical protein